MTTDSQNTFRDHFIGAFTFTLIVLSFAYYASRTTRDLSATLDCEVAGMEAFDRDLTISEVDAIEDACSGGR